MRHLLRWLIPALSVGCAAHSNRLPVEPSSEGPSGAPGEALAWAELTPATFARARAEKRFLVIDGSAEWCHWCHVMEAVSYHDPSVRKILDAHFVAVKVDVDSRPDFEERYGNWGWPATVVMNAEGVELGKYRGYLPPEKFVEILTAVIDDVDAGTVSKAGTPPDRVPTEGGARPLSDAEMTDFAASAENQLEEYWDAAQGSWGHQQKVPLYWDNAWALERARGGDPRMRQRVLFTLDRQRGIIDPVWGGICQYSTDGDWRHPHYEKLLGYQAGAIDNYATAYAMTRDHGWLRTALAVRGFVDRFMTSPEGAFYATMDADLNAHERDKPFVTGHDYYAKTDAERLALGVPRVDTHEYASENGAAIAAYVTLFEASGDATVRAAAERAAFRILATHATPLGAVTHGARGDEIELLYLADNASFGFGLARLFEATHDRVFLEAAKRIATFVVANFFDAKDGAFFGSTADPNAIGVFAARRKPFEENVMAVRFLAKMTELDPAPSDRDAVVHSLRRIGAREAVEGRGRMVGDWLLALEATRAIR